MGVLLCSVTGSGAKPHRTQLTRRSVEGTTDAQAITGDGRVRKASPRGDRVAILVEHDLALVVGDDRVAGLVLTQRGRARVGVVRRVLAAVNLQISGAHRL